MHIDILLRVETHELDRASVFRFSHCLLDHLARRSSDVERPHSQLRARLTNRLRCNDADRLAFFNQSSAGQVASVAGATDATTRLTGQHRPNFHTIDRRLYNCLSPIFINLLIG
ncbi:MAG: hypothetical protein JW388_0072 [Nitrospira sp.]|nr:hypothetical protein [Nitrospira sp.]